MRAPVISQLGIRERLYKIIFEADTAAGRVFDLILLGTIFVSVLTVTLGSVTGIQVQYGRELRWTEWSVTFLFTVEYILRLVCVQQPLRYALSFFGLVDLAAILPTYISILLPGHHSLITIRALRLLQIFRVLKLNQFIREESNLMLALLSSIRKIAIFLYTVLVLVLIIGSLMYLIEGEIHGFASIPQGIYWAIVTMTTVGYGDIAPQTIIGRLLAAIVMLLGYGIIAVPTGIVVADLSHATSEKLSIQTCVHCEKQGHDNDAKYCKYCGGSLEVNRPLDSTET